MTMTDAAISENHPHYQLRPGTILYRRGVQHDADGRAERLGRERVAELGADNAGVAVGTGDLAPDDADPGAADLLLGLVDVGDLLAEVEVRSVRGVNALDLDEAVRGVRDVAGACVGQVTSLHVKAVTLLGRHIDDVIPHFDRTGIRKGKKGTGLRVRSIP